MLQMGRVISPKNKKVMKAIFPNNAREFLLLLHVQFRVGMGIDILNRQRLEIVN